MRVGIRLIIPLNYYILEKKCAEWIYWDIIIVKCVNSIKPQSQFAQCSGYLVLYLSYFQAIFPFISFNTLVVILFCFCFSFGFCSAKKGFTRFYEHFLFYTPEQPKSNVANWLHAAGKSPQGWQFTTVLNVSHCTAVSERECVGWVVGWKSVLTCYVRIIHSLHL